MVGVLGPVVVVAHDEPVPLRPAEARIVALLAARSGEAVSAEAILDQVWEGNPPDGAKRTLGFHISHARRTLRESGVALPLIETVANGYRLNTEHVNVDAEDFEASVSKAAAVVADAPETALALAESALGLWRGEAYHGQYGIEPIQVEARRLDELRIHAREIRVRALLGCNRPEHATLDAQRIATEHPHRETVQALVMLALYRSGRQREALAFFDRARADLIEETGLEASRDLANLASLIARQDPTLDPSSGFDEAITATLTPGTPFVGRETELGRLRQALNSEQLVSVVGSGGVGKTRLVGELLASVEDTHCAAYLGPVRTGDGVPVTIADALGVSIPTGSGSLAAIASQIGTEPTVLLLDNAEHLLDPVRTAVGELLSRAPELTILVTTRQPLGTQDELVVHLDPLSTITEGHAATPAARMFTAAAARIDPSFELSEENTALVQTITDHLDGLPLAIELAAAQLRRVSLAELDALIESNHSLLAAPRGTRASRHTTLTAALEWSYRMLPPDSRETLRLLTAFRGGATLRAIAAVADDQSDALTERVLDLVDRSLVNYEAGPTESRYWLLETTKRHLLELTSEEERAAHRDRHLEWVADLVSRTAPVLRTRDEAAGRAALELEEHNLRSAIEWSIETRPEIGIAIIGDLKLYLVAKDRLSNEARSAVEALDRSGATATDRTIASFQACAGVLDFLAGDLDRAIPHYQKAIEHWTGDDVDTDRFRSRNELALALIESRRVEEAGDLLAQNRRWTEGSGDLGFAAQVSMLEAQVAPPAAQDAALLEARLESEEAGRVSSVAYVTEMRGWLLIQTADYALAKQEFTRSMSVWGDVGNEGAVNSSLCGIGVTLWLLGHLDEAVAALTEAVDIGRRTAWSRGHARSLNRLAAAYRSVGDLDRTTACLNEAIAIWSEQPLQPGLAHARLVQAAIAADEGDMTRSVAAARRAEGIWRQLRRHDGLAAAASLIAVATESDEARNMALQEQARSWTTPFVVNGSLFPEVSSMLRWLSDYEKSPTDDGGAAHDLAGVLRSASVASWDRVVESAAACAEED